ncbi:DUF3850 domain-containing protein [Enterobacter chuandaensis]|uniref:DUF3850 domain-containing protein n=1 Tax=Enterobacter chuandaensis TaxID=2497875 RepID=UPI0039C42391
MSTITREPVTHNLKIWPEYFAVVRDGLKRAELRWNDREYQAGDILDLCEWDPNEEAFTGDFISVTVTHVADLGQWMPGYVLLSVAPPAPVSVPDAMDMDDDFDSAFEHGKAVGWNAYRAAMLQGAENSESPTTIQTAQAMDSSPKIAESPSGNSPVIPDGLCPCCGRKQLKSRTCSVEGCEGKHVAHGFCKKHYDIERKKDPSRRESIRAADERYRARKSAASQQEVK